MEHGKNVICEKPFTTTTAEAVELTRLAKENHLFLIRNLPAEHLWISTCIIFIFWLVVLYVNAVVPKIPPVKTMFRSWVKKDISMSVPEAVIVKTADLYSVIQNVLFV
ncbi:MAG: Gfo/Idh/MocA family oxidoreductase [Roseburia inulinivorans]